ncbi:hypothetical protein BGZ68_006544 [Mortierella alpina]|nr:hypothetical protein BGZ68_006544 [Mortierella alpina]
MEDSTTEKLIMEDIITEKLIMEQAFSNLFLFRLLFMLTQCLAVGALMVYPFKRLNPEYHSALTLGITLFNIAYVFFIFFYQPYPFIRFESLYAARDDANKCLDLLHLETLKNPTKTSYSATYGSCTAFLGLWLSDMDVARHAALAEIDITHLKENVAARYFMGTDRISSRGGNSADDIVESSYASVHCTKSWGGIARWIAQWQLHDSIRNRTPDVAPSEANPLFEESIIKNLTRKALS